MSIALLDPKEIPPAVCRKALALRAQISAMQQAVDDLLMRLERKAHELQAPDGRRVRRAS